MTIEKLIDEVLKLDGKATKGPWKYDWGNWQVETVRPERDGICSFGVGTTENGDPGDPFDGELIAHYRQSAPVLAKALNEATVWLRAIHRETTYSGSGISEWAQEALEEIEKIVRACTDDASRVSHLNEIAVKNCRAFFRAPGNLSIARQNDGD